MNRRGFLRTVGLGAVACAVPVVIPASKDEAFYRGTLDITDAWKNAVAAGLVGHPVDMAKGLDITGFVESPSCGGYLIPTRNLTVSDTLKIIEHLQSSPHEKEKRSSGFHTCRFYFDDFQLPVDKG